MKKNNTLIRDADRILQADLEKSEKQKEKIKLLADTLYNAAFDLHMQKSKRYYSETLDSFLKLCYHNDVQILFMRRFMKTVGIRALRTNPGMLSSNAKKGELTLVTNHAVPVSISIPFDDTLLALGIHVMLAIKLFEEGSITLKRAAKLADLSVASFLSKLAILGVVVVDQTSEELDRELKHLG